MRKLLKLEIEKFKLERQIIGVIMTILGIIIFLTISFIDTYTDSSQRLDTSENILWMINLLNTGAFLVYSSTLVSKIIINEYLKGTVYVLFSYPINKVKIILSKVLLIFFFTVISTIIGNIVCTIYVNILNANIHVMTEPIPWNVDLVLLFTFGSILGGILSFLPFVTGMFSKSTSVPIVTAVISVAVMQAFIGRNPEIYQAVITLIGLSIFTIMLIGYTFSRKIQT